MKIIQLLPTLSFGDAVGNHTIELHKVLTNAGYDTEIYAENIDKRYLNSVAKYYTQLPKLSSDDILIYHFSTGCKALYELLKNALAKRIMIYHNITPDIFFQPYSDDLVNLVKAGRAELASMAGLFDFAIADSEYNRQELIDLGFSCKSVTIPILIPYDDYKKKPSQEIIDKYKNDGYTNILFVGRYATNKRLEDIIGVFAYYNKFFNNKSRLFLIGNKEVLPTYTDKLVAYIDKLDIAENVIMPGHCSFADILGYYSIADVFLCMSEHEGFCVPLVEAMLFDVPIVAKKMAAVPETLGEAGIIIKGNDYSEYATAIYFVVNNKNIRDGMKNAMKHRLKHFDYRSVSERYLYYINNFSKDIDINTEDKASNIGGIFTDMFNDYMSSNPIKENYVLRFSDSLVSMTSLVNMENQNTELIVEQETISWRRKVKQNILKPVFSVVYKISPKLALYIKTKILLLKDFVSNPKDEIKVIWLKIQDKMSFLQNTFYHKKTIYVDLTQIARNNAKTGIQRVVSNIFDELKSSSNNVVAIRNHNNLIVQDENVNSFSDKFEDEKICRLFSGDKLLLLDSSWEYADVFLKFLTQYDNNGYESYGIVHDLFPIQYPQLFNSDYFIEVFTKWHNMLVDKCDNIICVSKTTADVVVDYYKKRNVKRTKPLKLYFFHLGSEVELYSGEVRECLREFVDKERTFLMVGTIELRKGHSMVLDAFSKTVDRGVKAKLLIIGKDGWLNSEFKEKLNSMSSNYQVLWISDANDSEVQWAYKNCAALIAASKDEGFGLPLVEAAHFGLPIICSNIPIFHEVTQENADFFKVMDSDDLCKVMIGWLNAKEHPNSKNIRLYSWRESAEEILAILNGRQKPYKLLQ